MREVVHSISECEPVQSYHATDSPVHKELKSTGFWLSFVMLEQESILLSLSLLSVSSARLIPFVMSYSAHTIRSL
jgi:hypothetical protein